MQFWGSLTNRFSVAYRGITRVPFMSTPLSQQFFPAAFPTAQAAALLCAVGDNAAPFFIVWKQFVGLIRGVRGELHAIVVEIKKIDAALALRA